MKITESLRGKYSCLWEYLFSHPFVQGIGNGTLSLDRFQFYIKQDYLFLENYCRVLAIAAAKAPDLVNMKRFSDMLGETLEAEMSMHVSFCASFGVSEIELIETQAAPVTLAYSDYLLRVAYEGTLIDIIATLLPCQWGYHETGLELQRTGNTSTGNPYRQWIRMYASDDFGQSVSWLRELLDHLAKEIDSDGIRKMEEHFGMAIRYEYLFWDMSYDMNTWPV
jgi:thiaminase/transcriptional activator TenA